jgi:signal peptidase I
METTNVKENRPRRPVVALLLSMEPGVGHIYCGQLRKGIIIMFLATILILAGFFCLIPFPVPAWFRTLTLIAAGLSLVVWIWASNDAWRLAKRIGSTYILKDYNRWYLYGILMLPSIPVGFTLAFYLRDNVMTAFRMAAPGMEPIIQTNDRVLANKLAYRQGPVRRGDIVALINPNKRSERNIKRVVAIPGDKVVIQNGSVYVNNQPVPGSHPDTQPSAPGHELPEQTVLNGHCFVLCDDRSEFYDSRTYGQVPLADIIGRIDYIYYPRWVNLTAKGEK